MVNWHNKSPVLQDISFAVFKTHSNFVSLLFNGKTINMRMISESALCLNIELMIGSYYIINGPWIDRDVQGQWWLCKYVSSNKTGEHYKSIRKSTPTP